ncbi:unnamed protein product [Amoebophrya sp. A25]|nr:unnamed protein product [Amoebophrya sp. A25]|eukprot:GSA25T00027712001.1
MDVYQNYWVLQQVLMPVRLSVSVLMITKRQTGMAYANILSVSRDLLEGEKACTL